LLVGLCGGATYEIQLPTGSGHIGPQIKGVGYRLGQKRIDVGAVILLQGEANFEKGVLNDTYSVTMETSGNDGISIIRARRVMIRVETEEETSNRPEQVLKTDSVFNRISPLIFSMRAFGLYFTRKQRQPLPSSGWLEM